MSVNETLANQANMLLYGSMASYAGAFLAYAADLAGGAARAQRRREQEVAQAGTAAPATAAERDRQLAAVGGGTPSGSSSSTATGSVAGSRPVDPTGIVPPPAAPARERRKAAGIGTSLTVLSLLLHGGSVLLRGIAVQRPPWGNMFEFSTAGAVVVTLVYLLALKWRDLRYLGAFVVGPVLLTLGLSITVLYARAGQLVPALKSYWLAIHVSVAFIASAMLTLAFSLTVLYLAQDRRERRRAAGQPVSKAFMDALPAARELDLAAYRLHAVAFPLWTFTLVAGAIWAESAWGSYWSWDPKEVWTFVIWVVYAGYLHARATGGWQGRKAATIAIVGFGCLLFNFLVVNIFFVGFHSYAGVS